MGSTLDVERHRRHGQVVDLLGPLRVGGDDDAHLMLLQRPGCSFEVERLKASVIAPVGDEFPFEEGSEGTRCATGHDPVPRRWCLRLADAAPREPSQPLVGDEVPAPKAPHAACAPASRSASAKSTSPASGTV